MHSAQLELQPEEAMPNPEMFLICAHHSSYMCIQCGMCSNCCKCQSKGQPPKMPPLKSTISMEAQERLRELRRVRDEEYGRQVKPS